MPFALLRTVMAVIRGARGWLLEHRRLPPRGQSGRYSLQRASNSEPQFCVKATGKGALAVLANSICRPPLYCASLTKVIAEPSLETTIVVDLSGVTFTTSSGSNPLLEARLQLVTQGRH